MSWPESLSSQQVPTWGDLAPFQPQTHPSPNDIDQMATGTWSAKVCPHGSLIRDERPGPHLFKASLASWRTKWREAAPRSTVVSAVRHKAAQHCPRCDGTRLVGGHQKSASTPRPMKAGHVRARNFYLQLAKVPCCRVACPADEVEGYQLLA